MKFFAKLFLMLVLLSPFFFPAQPNFAYWTLERTHLTIEQISPVIEGQMVVVEMEKNRCEEAC